MQCVHETAGGCLDLNRDKAVLHDTGTLPIQAYSTTRWCVPSGPNGVGGGGGVGGSGGVGVGVGRGWVGGMVVVVLVVLVLAVVRMPRR